MPATIPTGSIITYQSSDWYAGWFKSSSDVINAVAASLITDGLTIRDKQADIDIINGVDKWLGGPAKFSVTLKVQVTGGLGYSKPDDVAKIINHRVYLVTGYLPSIYTVPNVSLPDTGPSGAFSFFNWLLGRGTSTGQPSSKSGSSSLSNITSKGLLYIGLAIFGFVAALALIGYSGALRHEV